MFAVIPSWSLRTGPNSMKTINLLFALFSLFALSAFAQPTSLNAKPSLIYAAFDESSLNVIAERGPQTLTAFY